MSELIADLITDLSPEELEPRLELQVFVDPMSAFTADFTNNCCRDGGNCSFACDNNCRDGGNCNTEVQFVPGRLK